MTKTTGRTRSWLLSTLDSESESIPILHIYPRPIYRCSVCCRSRPINLTPVRYTRHTSTTRRKFVLTRAKHSR